MLRNECRSRKTASRNFHGCVKVLTNGAILRSNRFARKGERDLHSYARKLPRLGDMFGVPRAAPLRQLLFVARARRKMRKSADSRWRPPARIKCGRARERAGDVVPDCVAPDGGGTGRRAVHVRVVSGASGKRRPVISVSDSRLIFLLFSRAMLTTNAMASCRCIALQMTRAA